MERIGGIEMSALTGRQEPETPADGLRDTVRRTDIETLAEPHEPPCVSILVPIRGGGVGAAEDRIRLRNVIDEASDVLRSTRVRPLDVKRILAPAKALLSDVASWEGSPGTLALFLALDRWDGFHLPLSLRQRVVVGRSFHVRPLIPLLTEDGRFFVLALSQGGVRLLVGTRDHVHEVRLRGVPQGMSDALRYDDLQRERSFHISGRQGHPAAIAHGHGIGGEVDKERVSRYLRSVDGGLAPILHDESAPLVLAGVDYERAIFRKVTTYAHVLPTGIRGDPTYLRADELHRRAWPLVEPIFREARQEAEARYRQLDGTGETTHDLTEIVIAADRGRVAVLFVGTDAERWGRFDRESGDVTLSDAPGPLDQDLLELATVRTFATDGSFYAGTPDGTPVAAILRY
jgi:hypothetical protein